MDRTASTIIGLANECVPLRAIARAAALAPEEVRDVLSDALGTGRIAEMPRDDWPAGVRGDRTPFNVSKTLSDEELMYICIRLFKVTRLQASLLVVLLKRNEVSKETMHRVIEERRGPNKSETDPKMVDVVVCHLRKRLKPFKVDITTLWGCGYYIVADHRTKASKMIQDFLGKTVSSAKGAEIKTGILRNG